MLFDKNLSPLYGWLFPEDDTRVNIGVCIEGEGPGGEKTTRNVRDVFERFLDDHFRDRLRSARQIGRLKGHPIAYTTWISHTYAPGILYVGEAARITHNATGEGIYQAMQSGIYAADAAYAALSGEVTEREAMRRYTAACRRRFTVSFLVGHAVRGLVRTPILDGIAMLYNSPAIRSAVGGAFASALAGSSLRRSRQAPGTEGPARAPQAEAQADTPG
jgi:flavin-dependent dehydrogenase